MTAGVEVVEARTPAALRWAMAYARLDWPTIPVRPGSKAPAARRGWKDGSTDPDQLHRWFGTPPAGDGFQGVAVCVGLIPDLWVLDCDPRHGGHRTLALLEVENGPLAEVPTVETGGAPVLCAPLLHYGRHMYFSGTHPTRRVGALPGLDVVTGYSIAPPTAHATTGRPYRWSVSPRIGLAPAPDWLRALLSLPKAVARVPAAQRLLGDSSRYIAAAVSGIADELAGTAPGGRQVELNRAAFRLGRLAIERGGIDVADAIAALLPAAAANGLASEIGPATVEATIRRAFGAGQRGKAA